MKRPRTTLLHSRGDDDLTALVSSPEEGCLALVMSIFETAFDDLSTVLSPPKLSRRADLRDGRKTRASIATGASRDMRRRVDAVSAAAFLDDADNLYLHWLRSCGVDVPVKRMLSELRKLKAAQPSTTRLQRCSTAGRSTLQPSTP